MVRDQLRILLTNDDGIDAPGLWAAARALRQVGDVFVVAPDREQSGVGASLTLHTPLRVRSMLVDPALAGNGDAESPQSPLFKGRLGDVSAYAVEGTPGDSCILALEQVVGPVDLVVSGINSGSNLGWDVMLSGTVGAALQGYVRGYPTIAISVGSVENPRFDEAAMLLQLLGLRLSQQGNGDRLAASPFFLNINVPSLPLAQIKGVLVTELGNRSYGESVRQEGDGAQKRFWISRNRPISGNDVQGTDIWALRNDRISITPLQLSLGSQQQIPAI